MAEGSKRPGGALRAASAPVSPALEQLRRGALSLEAFIEEKVTRAMAHVDPRLSDEQRDQVRQTLREHVMTDPSLQRQLEELSGRPLPEA
jgi:hypothetical protein